MNEKQKRVCFSRGLMDGSAGIALFECQILGGFLSVKCHLNVEYEAVASEHFFSSNYGTNSVLHCDHLNLCSSM